jgi:hypothetical protein
VVAAGDQAVNTVLQAKVLLPQLVQGGEQGGDVEVAGLLHEEAAALFPVPLQQLLKGLRLARGVQHAGDSVGLALQPADCLRGAPPPGQGDPGQLGDQLRRVGRLVVRYLALGNEGV